MISPNGSILEASSSVYPLGVASVFVLKTSSQGLKCKAPSTDAQLHMGVGQGSLDSP